MERRKPVQIPDAVNCSKEAEYSRIPNEAIRNPKLSAKAKSILCILLSNKEGWASHITTLSKMMKEGLTAIKQGLTELEEVGYLKRYKYRNIETKQMAGSFWAYADAPFKFKIKRTILALEEKGFEIINIPQYKNPQYGNPHPGIPITNNTNYKNTNLIICPPAADEGENYDGKLLPSMFDKFYEIYPRREKKGDAKVAWENLCKKSDRPTFRLLRKAISDHKGSEQWMDPDKIPLPASWLNGSKWLNDAKDMKRIVDYRTASLPKTIIDYDGRRGYLDEIDGEYYYKENAYGREMVHRSNYNRNQR